MPKILQREITIHPADDMICPYCHRASAVRRSNFSRQVIDTPANITLRGPVYACYTDGCVQRFNDPRLQWFVPHAGKYSWHMIHLAQQYRRNGLTLEQVIEAVKADTGYRFPLSSLCMLLSRFRESNIG